MTVEKKKVGRPTNYTPELAKEICSATASSSVGLAKLCKENPTWPHRSNIYCWLATYPEFKRQYHQSKISQVELLVDEILEIADDSSHDQTVNEEGTIVCNVEHIARSRLRIDARKWVACKLIPRVYGDKEECINLKLPNDITDVVTMSAEVFRALSNQEISPTVARTLIGTIKDHGNNIVLGELNERLAKLENRET